MIPNWNIGPIALRRLAEMKKAGWTTQNIYQDPDDRHAVWVEAVNDSLQDGRYCTGRGKTIHAAVSELYRKWREYMGEI